MQWSLLGLAEGVLHRFAVHAFDYQLAELGQDAILYSSYTAEV